MSTKYFSSRAAGLFPRQGIAASSIGALLKRGVLGRDGQVDPYINVTTRHDVPLPAWEVYVTDDGAETDWIWATTSASPL